MPDGVLHVSLKLGLHGLLTVRLHDLLGFPRQRL